MDLLTYSLVGVTTGILIILLMVFKKSRQEVQLLIHNIDLLEKVYSKLGIYISILSKERNPLQSITGEELQRINDLLPILKNNLTTPLSADFETALKEVETILNIKTGE